MGILEPHCTPALAMRTAKNHGAPFKPVLCTVVGCHVCPLMHTNAYMDARVECARGCKQGCAWNKWRPSQGHDLRLPEETPPGTVCFWCNMLDTFQGRDLRLLEEPPSGGTFLVREDAIIASLDFACIIITTKAAYIVNPSKPATVKFMTLLKQRLAFAAANLPNANGFKTWEEKEQQLLVQAHAESGRHSRPHLWRSSSKNSTKGQHTQPQEQLQLPIQQQA
eukprot:scaffold12511_cov19-Tisochrysis_lutea.AAC.1